MSHQPVVLHQFPRAFGVANPSPFCIKVEMFLRMTDIPYEIVTATLPMKGPKGKMPWIEDGDLKIGDSALIIEHLKRTRGVDPDAALDAEACARDIALTALLDERIYWFEVYSRWLGPGWPVVSKAFFGRGPKAMIMKNVAQFMVKRQLHAQGTGRHTSSEIQDMATRDLKAVAHLMGDGPFVHGDRPTTIDATLYGYLVNLCDAGLPTPLSAQARQNDALCTYTRRITDRYFRDIAPSA